MSRPDWLTTSAAAGTLTRPRRWLWLALLLWGLVMQFAVGPHGIGGSWRECDTQAIARNLLRDDFDPLHPRVDWRGSTDGSVECEFPLYQTLVALCLRGFGDVDWPGRLLSLLSVVLATLAIHRLLERRASPAGALAGALAFLCGGHTFLLGERVIPDGLSLALAVASLPPFLRFLQTGRNLPLVAATVLLTLGALQKPPSLQLGAVMFLWTCMLAPQRLRDLRLWLAWTLVVGAVGAWLWHAARIGAATGLTFGVTFGDTKFPHWWHLFRPRVELELLLTTLTFGLALPGTVALVALVRGRRLDRVDLGLLLPVALALVASLRYSHSRTMGSHYHVFAALAGAWCVARAWPVRAPRWLWPSLLLVLLAQATAGVLRERDECRQHHDWPGLQLAAAVRQLAATDDRIVVASPKPAFDPFWQRPTNHEDPRIFHHAGRRGFAVPIDRCTAEHFTELRALGARWLVLPADVDAMLPPATRAWLDANTTPGALVPEGRVLAFVGG